MSKAFTKDDAESEPLARAAPELPPGGKRYVTATGFRDLQEELGTLMSRRLSDLTEAEKHRATWLTALLPLLTVVTPQAADRVLFGARVTVESEDGEQTTYRIVGPDEVKAGRGDVSVDAPLARAFLGKSEGDVAVVQRPRGPIEVTLVRIAYEA